MSTQWPEHPLDDVASYAVGALDPDDRAAVEAHLATCPRCQAELAAHREALSHLVPSEEPPPGLWDRIVADLPADLPADPPAAAPVPGPAAMPPVRGRIEIRARALRGPDSPDLPPPPGDAEDRGPAPLHLAGRPRRHRVARVLTGAAAAAVLVIAAVAATLALSGDDGGGGNGGGSEVAAADTAALARAAAQHPTSVAQLSSDAGEPVARLVKADEGTFVLFDELPALSADRAYQLWSTDAAQPVSLGVLGDGADEAVAVAVPASTVKVAISDAPAAGEPAPTGPIVATGSLEAA